MEIKLFNSTFEVELRILCLLGSCENLSMSMDRIVSIDFITCYAKTFRLPYDNLHGINDFMYGELSNRRALAEEAIKSLVIQGLVEVEMDQGFWYGISDTGKDYANKLESLYARSYKLISNAAMKKYKTYSDETLSLMIQNMALTSLKEAD